MGSYNFKVHINTDISQRALKHSAIEGLFSPGILFNTIKSGIAVDWPTLTASFNTTVYQPSDRPISKEFSNNGLLTTLSSRIPFEALIFPELGYKIKPVISTSYSASADAGQSNADTPYPIPPTEWLNLIKETNLAIRVVPYSRYVDGTPQIYGSRFCFPFAYLKAESTKTPEYSMATSNFLAETVKFFLKDEKLISFNSKQESQWKTFITGFIL